MRSICEAKHVNSVRARWKIDSGNKVDISGQPWLNGEKNPYITYEVPGIHQNKVCSLMSLESKSWEEDIIQDMFNGRDQNCIRQVNIENHILGFDYTGVMKSHASTQYVVLTECYKRRKIYGVEKMMIAYSAKF